jgi:hypothetical protein
MDILAVPGHALLWPFPVTDWMIMLRYVPRRLCSFPQKRITRSPSQSSVFCWRHKIALALIGLEPWLLHPLGTPDQESIYRDSLPLEFPRVWRLPFDLLRGVIDPCLLHQYRYPRSGVDLSGPVPVGVVFGGRARHFVRCLWHDSSLNERFYVP